MSITFLEKSADFFYLRIKNLQKTQSKDMSRVKVRDSMKTKDERESCFPVRLGVGGVKGDGQR